VTIVTLSPRDDVKHRASTAVGWIKSDLCNTAKKKVFTFRRNVSSLKAFYSIQQIY